MCLHFTNVWRNFDAFEVLFYIILMLGHIKTTLTIIKHRTEDLHYITEKGSLQKIRSF